MKDVAGQGDTYLKCFKLSGALLNALPIFKTVSKLISYPNLNCL